MEAEVNSEMAYGFRGLVWISGNPCPAVFSIIPWLKISGKGHCTFAQPYSSTLIQMWPYHDNTEKRTYLVKIRGDNLCEMIVPPSEFAVKTWKDICHLFQYC